MHRFSREIFLASPKDLRALLCKELAQVLTFEMRNAQDFHARTAVLIESLRAVGHDLWSYDESDDFEIWGPNYVGPSEMGIMLTFEPDEVRVEWASE